MSSYQSLVFMVHNITISGKICTGTSTLAKGLIQKLGWSMWSAGDFQREYVQKMGIDLEKTSLRSDEHEREIEFGMRKRLQSEEHIILEAWLGGFVAQRLDGVLKVLLVTPDDLRIDRLVNRDNITVDEAKAHMRKREEENHIKWSKLYANEWREWVGEKPIDFYEPSLYDLVIDTYSHSKTETLEKVLEKLNVSTL
ncbi:MAG: cytidylate kinase family protein [bacterium]|nr:cytidylate kinase family protein [bacterium]